jgi:FixJ family two-component response regulator
MLEHVGGGDDASRAVAEHVTFSSSETLLDSDAASSAHCAIFDIARPAMSGVAGQRELELRNPFTEADLTGAMRLAAHQERP